VSDDLVTFLAARYAEEYRAASDRDLAAGGLGESHATRDIDAKREILALHKLTVTKAEQARFDSYTGAPIPERYEGECEMCGWFDPEQGGCLTVRLLGSPFCDHPGYQPAWKP
jgi:hypothetical protein